MHIEMKKICLATDFSDVSEHSLKYAVTIARQFEIELYLLHVVEDVLPVMPEPGLAMLPTEEITANLKEAAERGLSNLLSDDQRAKLTVHAVVRMGVVHREICQFAKQENIDLLILGTHGRSGFAHMFLGSVTDRVIRTAPCPVLTIRHPEHDFIVPDAEDQSS